MGDISMWKRRIVLIAIMGLLILVAFQVISAEQTTDRTKAFAPDPQRLNQMLDRFEEAGIDVSEIRKAIEEGKEVTPEMLKSLRDQAREKIPNKNLQDRDRPNQKYTKEK